MSSNFSCLFRFSCSSRFVFEYRALGLTIFLLVSVVIFTPFHSC